MKTCDIKQLARGMVYAIHDEYAMDQGDMKEDLAEFFDWLESDGWPIAEKIVAGISLDDSEKPFEWLGTCVCIWRADKCIWRDDQGDELSDLDKPYLAFGRRLQVDSKELVLRGYLDKDLDESDWKTLHACRVFLECSILSKSGSWPHQQSVGLYEFGRDALRPPLGIKLPDMTWPYADTFYDSKDYTDDPQDYFIIMTPKCLDELKQMFDAYKSETDEAGRRYVTTDKNAIKIPDHAKIWRISDTQKNNKPALLIFASSMDCFWARASATCEHLYRTYNDVVDIKWVEVDVLDWLIYGDTTYDYFKPHAGREIPGHATSYEYRAKLAKKLYMTHPYCTYPCLLDDMGDTTTNYFKSCGGSGIAALVDRQGRLAWTSNGKGWGYWNDHKPPQRGFCEQFPWALAMERAILDIIDSDGLAKPELFQDKPDQIKPKIATDEKTMYLLASKVISVDRDRRILKILGRPSIFTVVGIGYDHKIHFNDPHEMTIHVEQNAKVSCRGIEVSFDDLMPGDIISGPGYKWIDTLTWQTQQIALTKDESNIGSDVKTAVVPQLFQGTTYLFGKIDAIDCDKQTITFKPEMIEGRGERFIAQAGDRLDLQGKAKTNWQAHEKWACRGDGAICLELSSDILIYKQGLPAKLTDCEVGDQLCLWYDDKDAGNDTIRAAAILCSRQLR